MLTRRVVSLTLFLLLSLVVSSGYAEQCNDATDNNGNGLVDMTDWYCKTPLDNDEGSFHSGVPGDDTNLPKSLDCWFDLNSGNGDDGCTMHACCDIHGPCPADLDSANFDPAQCTLSQGCRDNCEPQTKTACDCFGCCAICTQSAGCYDVFVNPVVSPACTVDVLDDPSKCRRCVPNLSCQNAADLIFINGLESPPSLFVLPSRLPTLESLTKRN